MKNLSQQIQNSINEDLTQINNRIKGTAFLEILKFKIIDKLPIILKTKLSRDKEDSLDQFSYEDESRIIDANIIISSSSKITLNKELKNDLLIICLSGPITVGIEDYELKKILTSIYLQILALLFRKDLNVVCIILKIQ